LIGGDDDDSSSAPNLCKGDKTEPNDSRGEATPYDTKPIVGCIESQSDVDFYEVIAPAAADAPAGAYCKGALTHVGDGTLEAVVYTASDNSAILENVYTTSAGAALPFYWAAAAGETYRVEVKNFTATDRSFLYTLAVDCTPVEDTFEPNDTRGDAQPIELDTPIHASLFAGYKDKDLKETAYDDWYSVELETGSATVALDDVPTSVRPEIQLLDPSNTEVPLSDTFNATEGGSINATASIETAGTYKLKVSVFILPEAGAQGDMVPDHFTSQYQLRVTQ
jgi:hypothetical protein